MISADTIDRIRERVSIAEIVGQKVRLERRGRSLQGLCPFHKEKTPSFHVNEERGYFHCFGCQAKGDVFRFLQDSEGLSFIEAVRQLAERVGIEVDTDLSQDELKQRAAKKRREAEAYEILRVSASFYQGLLEHHPERTQAWEELARRGLDRSPAHQEALANFKLGYAPEAWDELALHLRKTGADLRLAEEVGLLVQRSSGGGYYDRFRQRLMFAVLDLQGRVIAFSGRALPPQAGAHPDRKAEAPAKYINSPESFVYKKRDTVFGLYQAKTQLKEGVPCILVEGNFDVLSLHARGVTRAVAPLGTAFTVEQARQIQRFTSSLVLLFDADAAGRSAVAKSRPIVQELGLHARVAQLPSGLDPDEFVRKQGREALDNLVQAGRGLIDHLIDQVLDESFRSSDAQERAARIERVIELLRTENDPTVRALAEQHADRLASRLGIHDARTFRALERAVRTGLRPSEEAGAPPHPGGEAPRKRGRHGQRSRLEHLVLGALLDFPELIDSPELRQRASILEGELALAIAWLGAALDELRLKDKASSTLARASTGAAPSSVATPLGHAARDPREMALFGKLLDTLAKVPEGLRPFVEGRLAAPKYTSLEQAELEFCGNLKKLMTLSHSEEKKSDTKELEKARAEGNFDTELELLRALSDRAKKRLGL